VEPALGEKREETLRMAGIKTFFIVKALKPVSTTYTKRRYNKLSQYYCYIPSPAYSTTASCIAQLILASTWKIQRPIEIIAKLFMTENSDKKIDSYGYSAHYQSLYLCILTDLVYRK
jgi:hypothetical protein